MIETSTNFPPQRWERPLDFEPGHWKQQLPTKYLNIAVRGDIDALRQLLLEHPEFLNKRGAHNRTLLWEATRRGKLAAVQWLIGQGADINATGCYNSESHVQITPYCAAVYYNRTAVAAYLRALNPQFDIFRAAFLGDQERVREFLRAAPTLLNAEDPHDNIYFMPLLAFSVAGGHAALTDFLLQRGANVSSLSALLIYLAARVGRMDMIDLLVNYGADVRAVDSGIYIAVSDLNIMRYLLTQGAPATRFGKNGFPPLVYISRGDKTERPDKVQMLLEFGALVNQAGPKGKTALHYAAAGGHIKVMTVLLDHGSDPALKDDEGHTPLSLARAAGKTAAVALLTKRGQRPGR